MIDEQYRKYLMNKMQSQNIFSINYTQLQQIRYMQSNDAYNKIGYSLNLNANSHCTSKSTRTPSLGIQPTESSSRASTSIDRFLMIFFFHFLLFSVDVESEWDTDAEQNMKIKELFDNYFVLLFTNKLIIMIVDLLITVYIIFFISN